MIEETLEVPLYSFWQSVLAQLFGWEPEIKNETNYDAEMLPMINQYTWPQMTWMYLTAS